MIPTRHLRLLLPVLLAYGFCATIKPGSKPGLLKSFLHGSKELGNCKYEREWDAAVGTSLAGR